MCDALFAAVLVDDEVDEDARLPDAIQFDHSSDELALCFLLCRQLWSSGYDRELLAILVGKLIRDRDLDDVDRVQFKQMRAKFKHFRYAFALYSASHRYPFVFDQFTITMGHVQDAYRNGRRDQVLRAAWTMRLLLTALPQRLLARETRHGALSTPPSFRARLERDGDDLTAFASQPLVTGHQFHRARKIVGRQVSFWDTLRTLAPLPERYDMSRTLSAINGLMGDLHDKLVEQRGKEAGAYHRPFRLPDEIRGRLQALNGVYARERRISVA